MHAWPSDHNLRAVYGTSMVHGLVLRSTRMRLAFYHGSWYVLHDPTVAHDLSEDPIAMGHFDLI